MSLDCSKSYHGSNSSPYFAMAVIVVTTLHADGLRRSVPRTYVSKLDVLEHRLNLVLIVPQFGPNFQGNLFRLFIHLLGIVKLQILTAQHVLLLQQTFSVTGGVT
jgi:hypothetical protein